MQQDSRAESLTSTDFGITTGLLVKIGGNIMIIASIMSILNEAQ